MIRDILEATKHNLECELSRDERAFAELCMLRILQAIYDRKGMDDIRIEYTKWFCEYQKERAVVDYCRLPNRPALERDNEEII